MIIIRKRFILFFQLTVAILIKKMRVSTPQEQIDNENQVFKDMAIQLAN